MSHNITIDGGTTVRLPTAGKYCDRDIMITANAGGGEDVSAEVEEYTEQLDELETTINTLPDASGDAPEIALQEKSVTPTKAIQTVEPDTDYDGLSKVTVDAIPADYIIPSGTVNVTQNGTHDVRSAESVNVNVPAPAIKLQEKTATPTTSAQTVSPDSGYDGLSKVTVNAMPTATQATPSISVSSGGLITASATQSAGYVSAGTKSATQQLTAQAAQTITPGASDKTIASGRYLTGTQTIKGDANLVAGNIKSGVSIFGVTGTYEGSGGSGGDFESCSIFIWRSYLDYYLDIWYIDAVDKTPKHLSLNYEDEAATTVNNVAKGTLAYIYSPGYSAKGIRVSTGVSKFERDDVLYVNGDGGIYLE